MTDNDYLLAELGMIENIEAYSPDECQREVLQLLNNNPSTSNLRMQILELIRKHYGSISEGDWTTPNSFEHIQWIITVRTVRNAGLASRNTSNDKLQQMLRPAFELVKELTDKDETYYIEDLNRRWKVAGDTCSWEGVKRLPNRMVALTSSPIWKCLGSSELFDDGMDIDHPPFYINGGWLFGWRTITKKEWEGSTESNGIPS